MTETPDSDRPVIYSPHPRINGVLITPDDSAEDGALEGIVVETFGKNVGINRLEILQWVTTELNTAIFPASTTTDADKEMETGADATQRTAAQSSPPTPVMNRTLTDFDGGPPSGDPVAVLPTDSDPVQGAIRNASKNVLSDSYSIADCVLDLHPLEQITRPAYRLAALENSDYVPIARRNPTPTAELLKDTAADDIPVLLQTIIDQTDSSSDYSLSQRFVPYPPAYGMATEHDLASVIKDGPRFSLADYYNDGGKQRLIDTRSFDTTEFFTVEQRHDGSYSVSERHKHGETAASRARSLLLGHYECRDGYAGFHDNNTDLRRLFRDRDFYTKIALDEDVLGAFLALPAITQQFNPFSAVSYIDEPDTYESPVQVSDSAVDTSSPVYATQGSKEHRGREDRAASFFEESGWTVRRPDTETSGAVTDIVISKDGLVKNVEVEEANKSQPANIIKNAIRALHQGRDVIFIVKSKSRAQSIASTLADPIRDTTANGAQFLTQSTRLILDDGTTPLLPADDSTGESKWEGTWNGRLRLLSNGDVIAEGPADEPVSSYDYDTDTVEGAPPDDRTAVHGPMYPPKLCLLNHVEIRYEVDTHTFAKLQKEEYGNDWNTSDQEGRRKRYSKALETFWKQKVVSVPRSLLRDGREGMNLADHEISKQEFFDCFREEFYNPQCSRKTPGNRECGRAMPAPPGDNPSYFKEWNDSDRGISYDFLAEHTFAWETGIMSSDLPFVDETYRLD